MWLYLHQQKTEEAISLLNQMNPTDSQAIINSLFSSASLDLPQSSNDDATLSLLITHSHKKSLQEKGSEIDRGDDVDHDENLIYLNTLLDSLNTSTNTGCASE